MPIAIDDNPRTRKIYKWLWDRGDSNEDTI